MNQRFGESIREIHGRETDDLGQVKAAHFIGSIWQLVFHVEYST